MGKPAREVLFGQRLTDVKTLRRIAAKLAQHIPGRIAFDAFGDDFVTKIVTQIDDRAYDSDVLIVEGDVDDKRLVDFQSVNRQLLQVGQG